MTVLAKRQIGEALDDELADAKKKKLYDLTGTGIPIKQISGKVGMSTFGISRTWQRWEQLGMVIKDGKAYRRTFD